jgi:hypothetical protein
MKPKPQFLPFVPDTSWYEDYWLQTASTERPTWRRRLRAVTAIFNRASLQQPASSTDENSGRETFLNDSGMLRHS